MVYVRVQSTQLLWQMSQEGPGSCQFQLYLLVGGITGHGNGFVGPKAEDLGRSIPPRFLFHHSY